MKKYINKNFCDFEVVYFPTNNLFSTFLNFPIISYSILFNLFNGLKWKPCRFKVSFNACNKEKSIGTKSAEKSDKAEGYFVFCLKIVCFEEKYFGKWFISIITVWRFRNDLSPTFLLLAIDSIDSRYRV